MGREVVELRAYASVSKHNSKRDDDDAEEWNEFVRKVRAAAVEHSLYIDVMASTLDVHGWPD